MRLRTPRSTLTDTLLPSTTLFRSVHHAAAELSHPCRLRRGNVVHGTAVGAVAAGQRQIGLAPPDGQRKHIEYAAQERGLALSARRLPGERFQLGGRLYRRPDRKSTRLNSST